MYLWNQKIKNQKLKQEPFDFSKCKQRWFKVLKDTFKLKDEAAVSLLFLIKRRKQRNDCSHEASPFEDFTKKNKKKLKSVQLDAVTR